MHKVLVAFDGSKPSERAVAYVINLSAEMKQPLEIHLLNVQQEPVLFGEDYLSADMIEELGKSLLDKSGALLKEAGKQLEQADVVFTLHPAVGNIAEKIHGMVKDLGCDTIVMGTRGLGSFSGLLLGSVATRVLHDVQIPVVLIK